MLAERVPSAGDGSHTSRVGRRLLCRMCPAVRGPSWLATAWVTHASAELACVPSSVFAQRMNIWSIADQIAEPWAGQAWRQ